MKLYLYTHWNKYLGCCSQVIFDDHGPEVFTENVIRACKMSELSKIKEAKRNLKLVFLGVYDDTKMDFQVDPEKPVLIDFDDLIAEREVFEARVQEAKEKEDVINV